MTIAMLLQNTLKAAAAQCGPGGSVEPHLA